MVLDLRNCRRLNTLHLNIKPFLLVSEIPSLEVQFVNLLRRAPLRKLRLHFEVDLAEPDSTLVVETLADILKTMAPASLRTLDVELTLNVSFSPEEAKSIENDQAIYHSIIAVRLHFTNFDEGLQVTWRDNVVYPDNVVQMADSRISRTPCASCP
jgi:hypothetical protein